MSETRSAVHRRLAGRLVAATHNKGKLAELRELIAPHGVEVIGAADLGLAEPEETGDSFAANAVLKARAGARAASLPALADNSGLCVAALGDAPGIHSARWAGEGRDFPPPWRASRASCCDAARRRRGARISSASWRSPGPTIASRSSKAEVDGRLVFPPRGTAGFGYDPIFVPDGHARSFGEMSAIEKHGLPSDGSLALSHRARAFQKLARACLE